MFEVFSYSQHGRAVRRTLPLNVIEPKSAVTPVVNAVQTYLLSNGTVLLLARKITNVSVYIQTLADSRTSNACGPIHSIFTAFTANISLSGMIMANQCSENTAIVQASRSPITGRFCLNNFFLSVFPFGIRRQ